MTFCPDFEKLGLLSAQGPALPALRTFKLEHGALSTIPLWLSHLTNLTLNFVRLGRPGVAEALSGGPLVELHLIMREEGMNSDHWNWGSLELAHLTRLELSNFHGDVLGDVARARLPALRSADLPFYHSTPVSSVQAFASAFPELSKLEIAGTWSLDETANGNAALEALGREIVPRLESLRWHPTIFDICNEIAALLHSLLPAGPADGAPCWPRLCSLDLNIHLMQSRLTAKMQIEAYQIIARAAPHFPFLQRLTAVFDYESSSETIDAFVATAKDVKAWPLMRNISVPRIYDPTYNRALKLHEVWPQATVA